MNDDEGRTQRQSVDEQRTTTYSRGDGGGGTVTRTSTETRRQMTSYSHTDDLHQLREKPPLLRLCDVHT